MDFGKRIRKFGILPNICYLCLVFFNIMYKLLVILFAIKLNVRNSVFNYIKRKYGQDMIIIVIILIKVMSL